MFPIRCVIECVNESDCVKCSDRGATIVDSFAIVAGQTPLSQLVETVLSALGLQHLAFAAKGWIQMKNWKPLSFDQITDDPDVEIDYILKDVSNQMTLRILSKQADAAVNDCVRDLKDRLLNVAIQKMPKVLQDASAFRPQLKDFILRLVQGDAPSAWLDAEQINQFNKWLDEFSDSSGGHRQQVATNGFPNSGALTRNGPSNAGTTSSHSHHGVNGAGNQSTQGASRFSPMLEVPKLERWFRENPNPSRQKLQYYLQILNGSNFRKHAGKITYQQICNWFSNARASHRKKGTGQRPPSGPNSLSQKAQQQQQALDGSLVPMDAAPSSPGGGTAVNHWVNKVFSNNVRNLSIAFNDFIQSSPPTKLSKGVDGVVSLNVSQPSPTSSVSNTNHGQNVARRISISPSSEHTSSTSSHSPGQQSRNVSMNFARDDGSAITIKEEDDEDSGMQIVLEDEALYGAGVAVTVSPSASPLSMGAATLKAISDGLPTMAMPSRLVTVCSSSSSSATAAAAANANRTRLMFDPLTELPMLEKWFEENPHPSWAQVDQYTDQLNSLSYRQTYPPVSSHNLKIWFKNRRAKCKRLLNGASGGGDSASSTLSIRGDHV